MAHSRTSFRKIITRGLALMAMLCIYGFSLIGTSAVMLGRIRHIGAGPWSSAAAASAAADFRGGGFRGGGFRGRRVWRGGGFRGAGIGFGLGLGLAAPYYYGGG